MQQFLHLSDYRWANSVQFGFDVAQPEKRGHYRFGSMNRGLIVLKLLWRLAYQHISQKVTLVPVSKR